MGAKKRQNNRCPDQPGLSPSQLLHRLLKSRSQLQECRYFTPLGSSSPREDARSQKKRDSKDKHHKGGAAMKPTNSSGRQQEEARAPESRTFHYFTSLAPEIRIAIWECYFRDNLLPPPRLHDLMPYKCWHAECASKPASAFGSERILERHVLYVNFKGKFLILTIRAHRSDYECVAWQPQSHQENEDCLRSWFTNLMHV